MSTTLNCRESNFLKLFWPLLHHTDSSVGNKQLAGVYNNIYKIKAVRTNDKSKQTSTPLRLANGNPLIQELLRAVIGHSRFQQSDNSSSGKITLQFCSFINSVVRQPFWHLLP